MTDIAQSPIDLILSQLPVHLNLTERVSPGKAVITRGGYGDVFRGILRRVSSGDATETTEDALIVAIKSIRASLRTDKSFAKSFAKELYVWAKLEHPNIVKLEGFILEDGYPSLISEWTGNGTVVEYIKEHYHDLVDIALGIAKGIAYLHDECNVIHSDLKGDNILVNANGQPMLTDFGLSRMMIYSQTFLKTTSYGSPKGSARWMAYELLNPLDIESSTTIADHNEGSDEDEAVFHTKMSDMWAFGMVIYELLTGNIPYKQMKNDGQVFIAIVLRKEIPAMPNGMCASRNALWKLCEKCWLRLPEQRLTIGDAIQLLSLILKPTEQLSDRPKRKQSRSLRADEGEGARSEQPSIYFSAREGHAASRTSTGDTARRRNSLSPAPHKQVKYGPTGRGSGEAPTSNSHLDGSTMDNGTESDLLPLNQKLAYGYKEIDRAGYPTFNHVLQTTYEGNEPLQDNVQSRKYDFRILYSLHGLRMIALRIYMKQLQQLKWHGFFKGSIFNFFWLTSHFLFLLELLEIWMSWVPITYFVFASVLHSSALDILCPRVCRQW